MHLCSHWICENTLESTQNFCESAGRRITLGLWKAELFLLLIYLINSDRKNKAIFSSDDTIHDLLLLLQEALVKQPFPLAHLACLVWSRGVLLSAGLKTEAQSL